METKEGTESDKNDQSVFHILDMGESMKTIMHVSLSMFRTVCLPLRLKMLRTILAIAHGRKNASEKILILL